MCEIVCVCAEYSTTITPMPRDIPEEKDESVNVELTDDHECFDLGKVRDFIARVSEDASCMVRRYFKLCYRAGCDTYFFESLLSWRNMDPLLISVRFCGDLYSIRVGSCSNMRAPEMRYLLFVFVWCLKNMLCAPLVR